MQYVTVKPWSITLFSMIFFINCVVSCRIMSVYLKTTYLLQSSYYLGISAYFGLVFFQGSNDRMTKY